MRKFATNIIPSTKRVIAAPEEDRVDHLTIILIIVGIWVIVIIFGCFVIWLVNYFRNQNTSRRTATHFVTYKRKQKIVAPTKRKRNKRSAASSKKSQDYCRNENQKFIKNCKQSINSGCCECTQLINSQKNSYLTVERRTNSCVEICEIKRSQSQPIITTGNTSEKGNDYSSIGTYEKIRILSQPAINTNESNSSGSSYSTNTYVCSNLSTDVRKSMTANSQKMRPSKESKCSCSVVRQCYRSDNNGSHIQKVEEVQEHLPIQIPAKTQVSFDAASSEQCSYHYAITPEQHSFYSNKSSKILYEVNDTYSGTINSGRSNATYTKKKRSCSNMVQSMNNTCQCNAACTEEKRSCCNTIQSMNSTSCRSNAACTEEERSCCNIIQSMNNTSCRSNATCIKGERSCSNTIQNISSIYRSSVTHTGKERCSNTIRNICNTCRSNVTYTEGESSCSSTAQNSSSANISFSAPVMLNFLPSSLKNNLNLSRHKKRLEKVMRLLSSHKKTPEHCTFPCLKSKITADLRNAGNYVHVCSSEKPQVEVPEINENNERLTESSVFTYPQTEIKNISSDTSECDDECNRDTLVNEKESFSQYYTNTEKSNCSEKNFALYNKYENSKPLYSEGEKSNYSEEKFALCDKCENSKSLYSDGENSTFEKESNEKLFKCTATVCNDGSVFNRIIQRGRNNQKRSSSKISMLKNWFDMIDTQSTGTSECQSSLNTNENLIQRPKLLLTNSDDISPIQESTKEDLLYVCCQCSKSPSYNIGNNTCLNCCSSEQKYYTKSQLKSVSDDGTQNSDTASPLELSPEREKEIRYSEISSSFENVNLV